jgi:hypothetical protein
MATKTARDARLDALVAAAEAWAKQRTKELQGRVTSAKKILQGRTGSERLAQTAVSATSDLVVTEINDFLVTK